jgi:RNA polymerase sigma-70 factor (ECF subfamily)
VNADSKTQFVQLLTSAQPRLYSYIATLLGDVHNANNVLQEANLLLWTKADDFQPGTNFIAWAREIAYFKALSFVRDVKRDRLIVNHDLVERVFEKSDHIDDDERRIALRHCISELSERQQDLLRVRYANGSSVAEIARQTEKTEGAVKMALSRVRMALMACVQRRLAQSL